MSLFEILRAIVGLFLLFLPGFLLTYLLFRGKETLIERIVLGFSLSISLTTLILFAGNELFGLKLSLLTCAITIGIIITPVVLVLLRSKGVHLKDFLTPVVIGPDKVVQYVGLSLILAFAFFMAFIPHLNYMYPLHIDEWFHFGYSQTLTQAQGLPFIEPFYGETVVSDHAEIGFHFFLSEIKLLTGLSWINIFLFLPSIIFVLTTLTAFSIGKRANFGLEAAFFVALIPTTVRFLGPSFLVPVALGLFFLAIILFLLHCCEIKRTTALALFLLLAFLFLFHAVTATAAALLCLIYGFIILWKNESTGIKRWQTPLLIWASAFLSSSIYVIRFPVHTANLVMNIPQPSFFLPLIYDASPKFGFIPLALFVVGIGFLLYKEGSKAWGLIISSWVFLTIWLLFQALGIGVTALYERSILYFFLLAGIIAGLATKHIKEWFSNYFIRFTEKVTVLSLLVILILVIAAGVSSVRFHFQEPFYHLITESQYDDCLWIRENLDSNCQKVLVNPRMAIAFSTLSGRSTYASDATIIFWYPERLKEVDKFLKGNASDTSWLVERSIDTVYTELPINNPDLKKLREGLYIISKELDHEASS